jgi:hypothetical protein
VLTRSTKRHGKQLAGGEEGDDDEEVLLSKGVRHLVERGGVTRLPACYALPPSQRPTSPLTMTSRLPVIDLARLKTTGDRRAAALAELDAACRDYGFFQVVNHGVDAGAVLDVACRFFDLPFEQRGRYASSDIRAPVRYGTAPASTSATTACSAGTASSSSSSTRRRRDLVVARRARRLEGDVGGVRARYAAAVQGAHGGGAAAGGPG